MGIRGVIFLIGLLIIGAGAVGFVFWRSSAPPQPTVNRSPPPTVDAQPLVKKPPLATLLSKPAIEGDADGSLEGLKLEVLKKGKLTEAPQLWLIFPGNQKVDLPAQARRFINEHWKIACARYYQELLGPKDRTSRSNRMKVLVWANGILLGKLENMKINAPGGSRWISMDEAASLVLLLNTYAMNAILPKHELDPGTIV